MTFSIEVEMYIQIEALLKKIGPALTTKYIEELTKTGITSATARKRIQRAARNYKTLGGIRFERKARFIYHPDDYGTSKFWENLIDAFYTHGKSYWCAIINLKARGGMCAIERFPQICGAPIARKGQLSPNIILERLIAINLFEETKYNEKYYIKFRPAFFLSESVESIKAVELSEFIALG